MAPKATLFKAKLQIANMERNDYGDYAVTLARYPSETDERLMVRLLAFCLHADPALAFGKGVSTLEGPDLWLKDLTGEIKLWIESGSPRTSAYGGPADARTAIIRCQWKYLH